jgi:hypothetical protein
MTVSPDNTLFTKALCCWVMINYVDVNAKEREKRTNGKVTGQK